MAGPAKTLPRDDIAYSALHRGLTEKRVLLYTDARMLGRPGSPVFSQWDMFAPLIGLLVLSLLVLLFIGVVEWIVAVTLVLLYQILLAQRVVAWRLRHRTLIHLLTSPYNLQQLWRCGGVALAMAGTPEFNCIAPLGDWRVFVADNLLNEPPPALDQPALLTDSSTDADEDY